MKLYRLTGLLSIFFVFSFLFIDVKSQASNPPEEFEGENGLSTALSGGGITFLNGLDTLSLNPALLSSQEHYNILGSYMIPRQGRRHYTIGIIDFSKKSFCWRPFLLFFF